MAVTKEEERFLGLVNKETLKKAAGWGIVAVAALGLVAFFL